MCVRGELSLMDYVVLHSQSVCLAVRLAFRTHRHVCWLFE